MHNFYKNIVQSKHNERKGGMGLPTILNINLRYGLTVKKNKSKNTFCTDMFVHEALL